VEKSDYTYETNFCQAYFLIFQLLSTIRDADYYLNGILPWSEA